jgi:hypothetical protein
VFSCLEADQIDTMWLMQSGFLGWREGVGGGGARHIFFKNLSRRYSHVVQSRYLCDQSIGGGGGVELAFLEVAGTRRVGCGVVSLIAAGGLMDAGSRDVA